MDNQRFFETVIRLDTSTQELVPAVKELVKRVEALERKQHYWSGALAAVGVLCSGIGGAAALVFEWYIKK
ncbi:MAG: hypothetical protein ACRCZI_09590 [Cetobacterium sp.]